MSATATGNLVTRKQAAEVLNVHPSTIDRFAKRGAIKRLKVSGVVRFDLREFLESNLKSEVGEG